MNLPVHFAIFLTNGNCWEQRDRDFTTTATVSLGCYITAVLYFFVTVPPV